ncbi:KH domain RNA-binding protein [Absidia repens]|uniref:KH domain RNA-binding protein n=1 Tax=Absidia repens TaxID=90262 RepID=A0A1X2IBW7_9FUNG|nr:KH domain RNA-binding protein [Absidia repens]
MSQTHETEQQYTADHEQYDQQALDDGQLTLRALVSTKEAGVIIGKAGKNVAELRDATGVKAGVSKVVQGIHDRVLTVTGTLEGVAKAYSLMAQTLLENPIATSSSVSMSRGVSNIGDHSLATIRLLISHNLMGTVIGRQGVKIKHIQDTTGVRMVASKSLLPQSTERVVDVRGTVEQIQAAIMHIGQCLMDDKERAYGTILYNPVKVMASGAFGSSNERRRSSITRTGNGSDFSSEYVTGPGFSSTDTPGVSRRMSGVSQSNNSNNNNNFFNNPDIHTQHISIPSDMVGCIIGKAGTKISEIRQLSGSRISIAKVPHDDSGERMFTIQGTNESNERALFLLYAQLEHEKERRLKDANEDDTVNGFD